MLRVNNPHLAEDLVQETLVKAFRGFDKFRNESSVRSWLFQILKNEIRQYFRSEKRNPDSIDKKEIVESVTFDTLLHPQLSQHQFASAVEREEFWDVIRICFEKIPEHLLNTFLHRLANPEEKIEQLCGDLEISSENFSVRLFRTRLMLRKCVEQSWLSDQ